MKKYNIKHLRKLLDVNESCYIVSGKQIVEVSKEDFIGQRVDRGSIKIILQNTFGIDCTSWGYVPVTTTGRLLLDVADSFNGQ